MLGVVRAEGKVHGKFSNALLVLAGLRDDIDVAGTGSSFLHDLLVWLGSTGRRHIDDVGPWSQPDLADSGLDHCLGGIRAFLVQSDETTHDR